MSCRARLMLQMAEKNIIKNDNGINEKNEKENFVKVAEDHLPGLEDSRIISCSTNVELQTTPTGIIDDEDLQSIQDFEDSGSEYVPESESSDSNMLSPVFSPFTPRVQKTYLRVNRDESIATIAETDAAGIENTNDEALLSMPVSTRIRNKTNINKGPGRKRKAQPKQWKIKKIKAAYNAGIEHTNLQGKFVPARKMGDGCTSTCRRKCQQNMPIEHRQEIFNRFWSLGDITLQREYLLRKMSSTVKKTTKIERKQERLENKAYFLPKPGSDNNNARVCKKMFMDCFGINRQWIATIFSKLDVDTLKLDMRGKHERNISQAKGLTIQSVKDHVNRFPKIESHYLRQRTEREYLATDLNIRTMFRMYVQWMSEENPLVIPATQRQYTDIFNNDFNLSFFIPKKDRCNDCTAYVNQNLDRTEGIFARHLNESAHARSLKDSDKKDARESHGRILTVVFDFEKILTCPNAEISTLYYKRNFNSYNFTVYCLNNKAAHCFVWHECIAKRGPSEVVSCLKKFIEHEKNTNSKLEEIRFWADNCYHQNKNKILISFYAWAAKKYKINIIQRYLTKGHTAQNEGDSVHAMIEKRKKQRDVMIPQDWYEIIKFAKVTEPFYTVIEMTQQDFFNFKPLSEMANFTHNHFQISKLKELNISIENPLKINYRIDWNEPQQQIILLNELIKNRGRKAIKNPIAFYNFSPSLTYNKAIPISKAKWNDLNSLCELNLIDKKYHVFYKNLPYEEHIADLEEED